MNKTSLCNLKLPNDFYITNRYIQPLRFKGLLDETISFSNLTGDAVNGRYDLFEPIRNSTSNSSGFYKLVAYWTSENGLTTMDDIASSSVYNKKSQCSDTCEPGTYTDRLNFYKGTSKIYLRIWEPSSLIIVSHLRSIVAQYQ